MTNESKPYLEAFDPYVIPMQGQLMDLTNGWDYDKSTLEILLSGAYGSSKSIIVAHLVISHCLRNHGAVVCIGRRALPDLKKTFYSELCEHLVTPSLQEGLHYKCNDTRAEITFPITGSKVISASWADRKYKKFRSLKLSMFVLEEAAENDLQDREAFMTIKARLRRLPQVKENILICISNPDAPEHWLYEYFIDGEKKFDTRKVLYSVTSDNPFLDPVYVEQLLKDLSPKEAQRYIYGQWISLQDEVIYSCYDPELNYSETDYLVNTAYPICLSFDYNIGDGKPMSMCIFQYINDHFHFFDESVIFSARTENVLNDLEDRDLLSYNTTYEVMGDASGKNRDTRNNRSDYQIIYDYLEKLGVKFVKKVLAFNPPIRSRHNLVNSYCLNALGERRITVYRKCKTLHKGMKLTKLKKGANYIEDDSPSSPWQHISSSLGYGLCSKVRSKNRKSTMRQL